MPEKIRIAQYRTESSTRLSGAGTYFSEEPIEIPTKAYNIQTFAFHSGNVDNQVVISVQWGHVAPGRWPHVPQASSDTSVIWEDDATLTATITAISTTNPGAGGPDFSALKAATISVPNPKSNLMRLKYVLSGTTAAVSIESYVRTLQ